MKKIEIAILLVALTMLLVTSSHGTNPFTGKSGLQKENTIQTKANVNPWLQPVVQFSQTYQKVFKQKLTNFAKAMKDKPFGSAFWLFLWFSFLYGIFHAIGPGHGKSIAVSYFLSRPGKIVHGFLMGNLLTFSHVFSAVLLIMSLYFVLKVSGLTAFDQYSGFLKIISTILLIAVGIYLIVHSIHQYKHWDFDEEKEVQQMPELKSLILTSLVTGMVPCPGAAIILSYSILSGIVIQGLLAMVCVSLGMGLTTSGIALFSILSRQTFMRVVNKNMKRFKIMYTGFSCVGAGLIIAIAIMMLINSV